MKKVFIKTDSRIIGPLGRKALEDCIRRGEIKKYHHIWHFYQNIWAPLSEVEMFKNLFPVGQLTMCPKIIAVGGGKGGVGKTTIAAALAIELSRYGKRVIAVDADWEGPNLHFLLGEKEPKLNNFFNFSNDSLISQVKPTKYDNLHYISGKLNQTAYQLPDYAKRAKFFNSLRKLPADFVIVDMGPGISYANLEIFLNSDEKLLVAIPENTAMLDAFGFLRAAIIRQLSLLLKIDKNLHPLVNMDKSVFNNPFDPLMHLYQKIEENNKKAGFLTNSFLSLFRPKIVMNKVLESYEREETRRFSNLIKKRLGIDCEIIGFLDFHKKYRIPTVRGEVKSNSVITKSNSILNQSKKNIQQALLASID